MSLWEMQSDLNLKDATSSIEGIPQSSVSYLCKKKRILAWYILRLNEWKHFRRQFVLWLCPLCLTVSLFCLNFCVLNRFEIIRCIVKSLIYFNVFLLKYNWKENLKAWKMFLWVPEFGRPNRYTSLLHSLNTSLLKKLGILWMFFECLGVAWVLILISILNSYLSPSLEQYHYRLHTSMWICNFK